MIGQLASVFGAGVLTSLTPCIYPMIPITLGYLGSTTGTNKKRSLVFAFVIGQVMALTLLGLVAVSLGEVFGFTAEQPLVQLATAVILLLFSYFSWKGQLPNFVQKMGLKPSKVRRETLSFWSAMGVGAVSALMASPCATPVLGGVLATVAAAGSLFQGLTMMFSYALGISVIFLLLGLGLVSVSKLPRSGRWMEYVHKISSLLLGFAGVYYFLLGIRGL